MDQNSNGEPTNCKCHCPMFTLFSDARGAAATAHWHRGKNYGTQTTSGTWAPSSGTQGFKFFLNNMAKYKIRSPSFVLQQYNTVRYSTVLYSTVHTEVKYKCKLYNVISCTWIKCTSRSKVNCQVFSTYLYDIHKGYICIYSNILCILCSDGKVGLCLCIFKSVILMVLGNRWICSESAQGGQIIENHCCAFHIFIMAKEPEWSFGSYFTVFVILD